MSNQREDEIRGVHMPWYQSLSLICVGIGMGGFFFCFILGGEITPSSRPIYPQPELGLTHLVKVWHSGVNVYVSSFEYWMSTYGFLATLGFAFASGICGLIAGLRKKPGNGRGLILLACVISVGLIYSIWRGGYLK